MYFKYSIQFRLFHHTSFSINLLNLLFWLTLPLKFNHHIYMALSLFYLDSYYYSPFFSIGLEELLHITTFALSLLLNLDLLIGSYLFTWYYSILLVQLINSTSYNSTLYLCGCTWSTTFYNNTTPTVYSYNFMTYHELLGLTQFWVQAFFYIYSMTPQF